MTATPRFAIPVPPMAERNATLNYAGGSLTMSRGNFAAMFFDAAFLSSCSFVTTERSRNQYMHTKEIGGEPRLVESSTWTEISAELRPELCRYPSQTKSIAAGGEPIQIKIEGEWWTARLSGTHYSFMEFLCDSQDSLRGTVSWRSARGTLYGPVSNPLAPGEG